MNISPADFAHPEDQAALENLQSLPLFTPCLRLFMKVVNEEFIFGMNMAQKIRLGPDQLPDIYKHLQQICETLGIDCPELYLEMNPFPNAYTYGDTRIFITVTSGLVEALDETELRAVIAHECGHIVCRHVLYHTMADLLARYSGPILGPMGAAAAPVQLALLYWDRRSELSADRVAALVVGTPDPVIQVMFRLAGGPRSITGGVNLDAYLKQAEAYTALLETTWDKLLQGVAVMQQNHPFLSVRAKEIHNWCATDRFGLMARSLKNAAAGNRCPSCGQLNDREWNFCSRCGTAAPKPHPVHKETEQ